MELSADVVALSFTEGDIFFFEPGCPIGVAGHMHICIKKHDTILLLSTCSSKIDTALKLAQLRGYPIDTYPIFLGNKTNKFRDSQTYVNCNDIVEIGASDFYRMISDGKVRRLSGKMSEEELAIVANGVRKSTVVEGRIKELF